LKSECFETISILSKALLDPQKFIFIEIAYGLSVLHDTFTVKLQSGSNKILVKNESGDEENVSRFVL